MITIILPGYSDRNREWVEEVKEKLDLGHKVIVHNWKHWTSGSFSVKHEKEAILSKIGNQEINIIAKSIGTRMTMHLIPEISEKIKKIILCGIPTRFESETPRKLYKDGLILLSPTRVIVIQNERDPLVNFSVIQKFIHGVDPKIKVIKKSRSDHHYPYFEDFRKFLMLL